MNNLPFTSIVKNSDHSWSFTWDDAGATAYRIILYGQEIDKTTILQYRCKLPGFSDNPPSLEVVPVGTKALSEEFSSSFIIQWYRLPGAQSYRIDELQGATWTKRQTYNDSPKTYLNSYKSYPMEDETEHTFRLRAADLIGQFSEARQFTISIVTPPKFVDSQVRIGYDQATHAITVTGV